MKASEICSTNPAGKFISRFFPLLCAALVFQFTGICQADDLVPLKPKLPEPAFVGTPKEPPPGTNIEGPSKEPRKPLMIPANAKNLAPAAKLSTSDTNATPGMLARITDGNKEATDAAVVLLRKGTQYVQFDLGAVDEIFAIVIWHAHDTPKVYHSVVAQVADDAGFTQNVRTLFNNDAANAAGRGIGTDREYFETFEGKTIDAKGAKARYVRLYSKGSTDSSLNEYTEVEIYGRPAP
jgi:hypothetical protein